MGIDFEIHEASSTWGGRIKVNTNFTDFPIPLGAEWIETETDILSKIVNDPAIQVDVKTIPDRPDFKFVNSSWFGFFETYILPTVADKIIYNSVVSSIDYATSQISVATQNGSYLADKAILCVPLKVLQDGAIRFTPALPEKKQKTIEKMHVWDGFKAFFEFSTKFYVEEHDFHIKPKTKGQKLFYNAAHGQNTDKHVLGIFAVGEPVSAYNGMSNEAVKTQILSELDLIYDNQASPNYIQHIVQNWQDEPFIRSGYLTDHADWKKVKILGESVGDKLFFAGGEFTNGENWVSVHTAAESARRAVHEICS